MELRIKRLSKHAVLPTYAKPGDAGTDLTAISVSVEGSYIEYGTGLAVEIPEGYVGMIFPRSSVSNTSLSLSNSVGLIDSSYRGEIKFRFRHTNPGSRSNIYSIGERIGQLVIMPYPKVEIIEVDELSTSERGTGGYGSTGA